MKQHRKGSANYLDLVPKHRSSLEFSIGEQGAVTLFQENRGVFHFLAQKWFHKPQVSQIHLDEMGNFVWPLIDGKRTVYEIAELVREEFGEKAEPLYERLVRHIQKLEKYKFVEAQGRNRESGGQ